jgi:hypothetical protein
MIESERGKGADGRTPASACSSQTGRTGSPADARVNGAGGALGIGASWKICGGGQVGSGWEREKNVVHDIDCSFSRKRR